MPFQGVTEAERALRRLAGIAVGIGALTLMVLLAVGYVFVRVELAARWRIGDNIGGFFGSVPLVPVFALAILVEVRMHVISREAPFSNADFGNLALTPLVIRTAIGVRTRF